ncbi:hypothetical protein PICMEDRAFT_18326 [Pichia membranifaciens NRRL Y-2026]|uniref:Rad60/SUMO-like domain-containing protein n=1 Tax=Pichia membranifaciens NRRL Y-2026 TaxID=763406 RepID=A0A1E3NE49_9ASCO|nr:hypothetical protein PICMEDRAFT_18326 [Pichia membranifaciens NRRL Y-2026]ODQ44417.1 hypothetical protein PICMEDRAFT_18326 [Pichia membranifaciens NRRL Y-2026]
MPPIDDFFAFTNDDFSSPPQQKKRKKKKSVKTEINELGSRQLLGEKISDTKVSIKKNRNTVQPSDAVEIEEVEDDAKDEAALANLLGLSVSSPLPIVDASVSTDTTNTNEEVRSSMSDRESRLLNRTTIATESATKVTISQTQTNNNNSAADPDDFLSSINSYVTSIKEKEHEIQDLLQSHQQEEIVINGVKISPKSVKFEFHIDIQAAGQVSGSYDLQVKGSTKISKIVNTLMPLFNKEANPQCPANEWGSLVIYVKNLNIILHPSLRCMSLLGYKSQLLPSSNGADYELHAIIATEEYAQLIQEEERKKKLEENVSHRKENNETDDAFFNFIIVDPQRENKLAQDTEVIDLENDEAIDTKSKSKFTLALSVLQSMTVSELLMLFKYKARLPNELNTQIFRDNALLDPTRRLDELGAIDKQILEVKYSLDELSELQAEGGELDMVEEDDFDLEEIQKDMTATNEHIPNDVDSRTEYFSIFVAGSDKKRFKVSVKPSTKISDILNFYRQKSGLPSSTNLKLVFDDDDMDLNATVADTELEDEFMIDAVILNS